MDVEFAFLKISIHLLVLCSLSILCSTMSSFAACSCQKMCSLLYAFEASEKKILIKF